MKLRSRTTTHSSDSPSVTDTLSILPPNITRLQTPPASELSNAGSNTARRECLSELSSSMMDVSDTEETIPSVTPTKSSSKPKMTVPAAPLTTKNLAMHQEEITSAVEHASQDGPSSESPTSNTRMIQARNYLLKKDITSDPEFKKRYIEIATYLHNHKHEKGREEVLQLLKRHIPHMAASKGPTPRPTVTNSSRSKLPTPDKDEQVPQATKSDALKRTNNNKLNDLTKRVSQTPSNRNQAFAIASLQSWPLEKSLPSASSSSSSSSDDLSRTEDSQPPTFNLGQGHFMPREIKDVDWARDRAKLVKTLVGYDDVRKGEAQLLLAETPLLQKLMSEQIESDLASKVKNGHTFEQAKHRPAILMTQKFALPTPAKKRIEESAAIAKSLNIEPDEQAESPGTAKRRFEQESDDEVVEEEEEGEEEEGEEGEEEGEMSESSNSGVGGGVQGEYMYVDERVAARDSLIVGTVGGDLMMSGALQDP